MGELPIQVFIAPLIVIVLVVVGFSWRKKMMAMGNKMYAAFKLGDLAQRMGMQIAEGDPNMNMMMAASEHGQSGYSKTGGVVGAVMGDGVKQTKVRLVGSPFGHPMEFSYLWHEHFQGGVVENVTTHTFECRLSIIVGAEFPDFEIILRNPQSAYVAAQPKLGLPPQSFGNPNLDAALVLSSNDTRTGQVLAPAANGLVGLTYVHIKGHDNQIDYVSDQTTWSIAVYYLETMQRVLELMACSIEGKPLPTLPPAPHVQIPGA